MRVIANNVEYFDLMRDQVSSIGTPVHSPLEPPENGSPIADFFTDHGLTDSLWYFDGKNVQCWMDVEDLLQSTSTGNHGGLPEPVPISIDFYPSSIIFKKGIILGVDAELIQRRDISFAFFRLSVRVSSMQRYFLRVPKNISRHSSSSHRYYAGISPGLTLLQHRPFLVATIFFLTSHTLSKSFCTTFWMMRWTTPPRLPRKASFRPFYPFSLHSLLTSTSWSNVPEKQKSALGALFSLIFRLLKPSSKLHFGKAC